MPGSKAGGLKAYQSNIQRHGADFMARIGRLGGLKSRGGGFSANRELASKVGKIGGKKSSRLGVKNRPLTKEQIAARLANK